MEGAEHSRYVAQLRAEFDGCDTTSTGFLDREELTELSRRLQLDLHLPLLLDTLLAERPYGRVTDPPEPGEAGSGGRGSDPIRCVCVPGEL